MFIECNPRPSSVSTFAVVLLTTILVATPTAVRAAASAHHGRGVSAQSVVAGKGIDASRAKDDVERRGIVLPPHAVVAGKSIGEWSAEHWQWAFSFLAGQNPVFDDQTGELGYLGDVGGPVFFMGASSDVNLSFNVPCGKYLLFALMTQAWTLEGDDTEASARAENDAFVDSVTALYARVDGKRIPDLFSHREATPRLFPVSIPNGGLFGDVGGSFDAVSDGYWLMLKPLSPGMHTISFGGTALEGAFDYRAKFRLRVTGRCRDRN